MRLENVFDNLNVKFNNNIEINGISIDSRTVKEGYLFIKMLHDIDYLKDLKQVNVHGHNLLSSYLKEIYQICDVDKVYVTNYLLPPDKMKKEIEV